MARTNNKWIRPYLGGYAMGTYAVSVGAVGTSTAATPGAAFAGEAQNAVIGQTDVIAAPLNAILAPSAATGIHELCASGTGVFDYLIAYGVNALPVPGNPVFAWRFNEISYLANPGDGFVMADIAFASNDASNNPAILAGYCKPWGVLIHGETAETAVNTAAGIDDNGAASTHGGVFFWQLLSSDGTVTLKLQEASTNTDGNFADVTGATSGVIDASAAPVTGQAALSPTASIKRYLRWQIVLGTASTATFILGFSRGY